MDAAYVITSSRLPYLSVVDLDKKAITISPIDKKTMAKLIEYQNVLGMFDVFIGFVF